MSADRGLQAERTILAWNRTAFAAIVNAFLFLRYGAASDSMEVTGMGLLLLIGAGAIVFYGHCRRRQILDNGTRLAISNVPLLVLVSAILVASGIATTVIIFCS